jgi:hypothetical protein
MRSAGILVEAGFARWCPSLDNHIWITCAGFTQGGYPLRAQRFGDNAAAVCDDWAPL